MHFILFLTIEAFTIIGCIFINTFVCTNSVLELAKQGYKIDEKAVKIFDEKQRKKTILQRKLEKYLDIFPGINLIYAKIKEMHYKKKFLESPIIIDAMIPMTEEEKTALALAKGKFEKLSIVLFFNTNSVGMIYPVESMETFVESSQESVKTAPLVEPSLGVTSVQKEVKSPVLKKTFRQPE